jgi:hypothetical protein
VEFLNSHQKWVIIVIKYVSVNHTLVFTDPGCNLMLILVCMCVCLNWKAKLEGRRGVGRPKFRRLDDVEADLKTHGIKRWRVKAQDRKRMDPNSEGG